MQTGTSTRAAAIRFAADELHKALHLLADEADDQPGEYLTVKEAAVVLRVVDETIYRRIKDGTLESVRIGGRVLIPASALRAK